MKVAIFGAGTMGRGIAQVFAANGHTALMYASSIASAQRHRDELDASLQKRVAKGKMPQGAKDALMANVFVEEESAAADADLVIECIAEEMGPKKELFHRLDELCKPETVFATNTSSLSITEMGHGLKHPLIGMHFFNPVPSMKLVEIIRENFDLRPAGIIRMLDLRRPIYKQTAAYGHFGRNDLDLPWERLDKVETLKKYL